MVGVVGLLLVQESQRTVRSLSLLFMMGVSSSCARNIADDWCRHGGDQVSTYLRDNLHEMIEQVSSNDIVDTVNRYKGLGGFFRRFKGGILSRIATGDESDLARFGFATDQRATMAFMQVRDSVQTFLRVVVCELCTGRFNSLRR